MLSKTMKANLKIMNMNLFRPIKQLYNFPSFNKTTQDKLKEEQTVNDLHKYICSFTAKKFLRFDDSLLVDSKLLGKTTNKFYPVFKSNVGWKIIKVILLQLIMVIPCFIFLFYSFKWLKKEWVLYLHNRSSKLYLMMYSSMIIGNLFLLNLLRKNNLYKIWKYTKNIELSKDLKTLQITTFTNTVLNPKVKDVYLYYNFTSPYISTKSLSKIEDTIVIGVENKMYIVPLEDAIIQSKDLLSLCLRAQQSGSVWIYLAYSCITLSYLNVNILYIRILLILTSVFFICFAILVGNIFVDSLVFNSVFIIINGTYCYFLILKRLPVKMNPLEERIYEKDFKRVMDRRTFYHFIQRAHLRTFSEGGQICHRGNNFSGPFYVALINPTHRVIFIKQGREYFEIKENAWIGVVEFMMNEKEKMLSVTNYEKEKHAKIIVEDKKMYKKIKKNKVKWGLDAIVKENAESIICNDEILFEEFDEPCYVYEFPLGELEKLFNDKDEGVTWRNALYSIWLGYTTKAIVGVDTKVQAKRNKNITTKDIDDFQPVVTELTEKNGIQVELVTFQNDEPLLNKNPINSAREHIPNRKNYKMLDPNHVKVNINDQN